MIIWIQNHWVQIGIVWVLAQNFLKSLQDAIDAEPKDLKLLARISYYMSSVSGYLFTGNRVQSITTNQPKV